MNMKPITTGFPELERVEKLAKEAFPPEEYLSPTYLIEMSQRKELDFWALYDDKNFVGFMAVKTEEELSYLFFLAIDSSQRGKGYGGQAIRALQKQYPDKKQVVDLEMTDENAENNEQRKKRRCFYLKNGYCPTGFCISYGGVCYEILYMGEDFSLKSFQKLMNEIHVDGFEPRYFRK